LIIFLTSKCARIHSDSTKYKGNCHFPEESVNFSAVFGVYSEPEAHFPTCADFNRIAGCRHCFAKFCNNLEEKMS